MPMFGVFFLLTILVMKSLSSYEYIYTYIWVCVCVYTHITAYIRCFILADRFMYLLCNNQFTIINIFITSYIFMVDKFKTI